MKTTLLMDHHQNLPNGTVKIHKAGETVDLPDKDVEYIHEATVDLRKQIHTAAVAVPGSPENEQAREERQEP